jgi:hypothetical protein
MILEKAVAEKVFEAEMIRRGSLSKAPKQVPQLNRP